MNETSHHQEKDTESYVPWREFLGSSYTPSLALICLAVWLHSAAGLVVATMLPAIISSIGGASFIGWSVSLYEIGSIIAGAGSALLTLRYGQKAPLCAAATVFGLGCVLSAVSPNMPIFLAGRTLQGIGGGGMVAMGLISIGATFPRRYTARALAVVSTFWGTSAFIGPLVGGVFVEFATWRWGFVFFAAQAFVLALWIMRRPGVAARATESPSGSFPVRRLGLLCLAVVLISYAGVSVSFATTPALVLAGLLCLLQFLRMDARAEGTRLLPMGSFDLRNRAGSALLLVLTLSMSAIALTAFGPLLLVAIHGISPLVAGYIIACSSIGWTLAAVPASGAPERYDRLLIALGTVVVTASIVGLLYAVPKGPIWLITLCALMEGAGFGLSWTFILRRATSSAGAEEAQRISGAIPTVQRLGYALGAAYIGIVANAAGLAALTGPQDAAEVARWIFMAGLPFAMVSVVAMIALTRGKDA